MLTDSRPQRAITHYARVHAGRTVKQLHARLPAHGIPEGLPQNTAGWIDNRATLDDECNLAKWVTPTTGTNPPTPVVMDAATMLAIPVPIPGTSTTLYVQGHAGTLFRLVSFLDDPHTITHERAASLIAELTTHPVDETSWPPVCPAHTHRTYVGSTSTNTGPLLVYQLA